jgi:hypothetical protein
MSSGTRTIAVAVGLIAAATYAAPRPALAQTVPAQGTTSIEHDSEKARAMKEPSFQTEEERLNAKPLDWNETIGTPTPREATPAEKRSLARARPGAAAGGAPNPHAEEEARKLHPDDWK